jgi:Protein of unknown function (DUF3800)
MTSIDERVFVYLAYLDDSDTRAKNQQWQVLSAVLIPADAYLATEFFSACLVEELMPEDRRDKFVEFHACELYGGYGVFEGIPQECRFAAIQSLLSAISTFEFKIAYGAVDLKALSQGPFGSANPHDVAFRKCVSGAVNWITGQVMEEMHQGRDGAQNTVLFIMDEGDKKNSAAVHKSFRSLRGKFGFSDGSGTNLPFVHDDMYFGDSKYSIGIQIADLCSFFIAHHLAGDSVVEQFYKMIEPQIVSAIQEPLSSI